ncbi:hypothetical protein PHYPSEUDO_012349 [Phytophthora pseudosyringae]|uniref:Uncharacterized protein n=1 Tax=Phytophthora pseudosyringae TaxID=221518 RepID=A0A8T1VBT7_9STRA|nr:hypothetical protein PHYPSEUDO_012349 [Phytophthora pseudosyringae]
MPRHARGKCTGLVSPPLKAAKSTSVCEYCNKEFTTRGIPLHQKKCAKKRTHDKAADKKTRAYKFCILNEAIHEEILTFLSNQTLTKMQMITGDRYRQCEPELAVYCCKCEDDNPAIQCGLCRECESKGYWGSHLRPVTKRVAKDKYGVREKDFTAISFHGGQRYDRITLENYMIKTCGSKMEWVRCLVRRDITKKRALTTRKRKQEELDALLMSLAPGFAPYVWAIGFKETDKDLLEQCSRRFIALTVKVEERGLQLLASSDVCKEFITAGIGTIEGVLRSTEHDLK